VGDSVIEEGFVGLGVVWVGVSSVDVPVFVHAASTKAESTIASGNVEMPRRPRIDEAIPGRE